MRGFHSVINNFLEQYSNLLHDKICFFCTRTVACNIESERYYITFINISNHCKVCYVLNNGCCII